MIFIDNEPNTLLSKVEERQKLIDIYEDNKDLVQVDKFCFDYIDCTQLPEKYDEDTKGVGRVLVDLAEKIKQYEPTKDGLQLKYVQIRKQHGDMLVPWGNERAWNRLDIHIPLNKTTGGKYNFRGTTYSNMPGSLLMFAPLRDWWDVEQVDTPHYKLILRFTDLDKTLFYTGMGREDEVQV